MCVKNKKNQEDSQFLNELFPFQIFQGPNDI